jgi:hypothetical protein
MEDRKHKHMEASTRLQPEHTKKVKKVKPGVVGAVGTALEQNQANVRQPGNAKDL